MNWHLDYDYLLDPEENEKGYILVNRLDDIVFDNTEDDDATEMPEVSVTTLN
jgi:hypothetical protein